MLKEDNKLLRHNLKMVHSMLRAPKLMDIYQKKVMATMKQKNIEKLNVEAFRVLREQKVDSKNAEAVVKDLVGSVLKCLSNEKSDFSPAHDREIR